MRKPEQKVYDEMRKAAPKTVWLQRFENLVSAGVPDVLISDTIKPECWVELKAVHRPKRKTTRFLGAEGLRQSQINWHLKAATKNMTSYVLVRDDYDIIYLISGKHAADMNGWTRADFEGHCLAATQSWELIFQILIGVE